MMSSDIFGKEISMSEERKLISKAFMIFMKDAPQHAAAWNSLVQDLSAANALDPKTSALAYLAVLAALGLDSGVPFHFRSAKNAGASREEVISAILVGLPAAGHGVTRSLPAIVEAFDGE
jgi:alkylhydroperoxidase/carboxymuconolactone decarboxylase family protein YurZ